MKNIAITVDKNYSFYAAVMLYSLLANNNASDLYIHIILNFKNPFLKFPIKYVLKRKKCKYKFYLIQEKDIVFAKDLIITLHISIATYFRLFLPTILKDLDKVLFLDSDIVVDGSIDELYAVNINNYALAAILQNNEERMSTLGLTHGYFNAGVMLLNLAYLREHNFEPQFEAFIKNHPDKIQFWDQDVLNAVTQDNMIGIDAKWNNLSYNYDGKTPPVIIHYAGTHKPWGGYSDHLFKDKYFEYLHKDKFLFILNVMINTYSYIQKKFQRYLNNYRNHH